VFSHRSPPRVSPGMFPCCRPLVYGGYVPRLSPGLSSGVSRQGAPPGFLLGYPLWELGHCGRISPRGRTRGPPWVVVESWCSPGCPHGVPLGTSTDLSSFLSSSPILSSPSSSSSSYCSTHILSSPLFSSPLLSSPLLSSPFLSSPLLCSPLPSSSLLSSPLLFFPLQCSPLLSYLLLSPPLLSYPLLSSLLLSGHPRTLGDTLGTPRDYPGVAPRGTLGFPLGLFWIPMGRSLRGIPVGDSPKRTPTAVPVVFQGTPRGTPWVIP
jgi:hypothetical protein